MPIHNANKSDSGNGHLQHGYRNDTKNESVSIHKRRQNHSRIEETNVTQNPPKPRGKIR